MPEAHSRSPCAGSAGDDDGHAIDLVAPCQQRVSAADQIAEGPDLAAVGMTAEHQACAGSRRLLSLPGL